MSPHLIRGCAEPLRYLGSKPPARRCERVTQSSRGTVPATCPVSLSQEGLHYGRMIVEPNLFVLGTSEQVEPSYHVRMT